MTIAEQLASLPGSEIVAKAWGVERWLVDTPEYGAKFLFLREGWQSSLHRHARKDETFVIVDGAAVVETQEAEGDVPTRVRMIAGLSSPLRITPGTLHRFWADGGAAVLLEVSTAIDDVDVERVEVSGALASQPPATPNTAQK